MQNYKINSHFNKNRSKRAHIVSKSHQETIETESVKPESCDETVEQTNTNATYGPDARRNPTAGQGASDERK